VVSAAEDRAATAFCEIGVLDILKKTVTQVRSQTLLFFLRRTRFSKSSSLIKVRLLFMARPAQLKRRSAAALAGRGMFSLMKMSFSCGQAVMLLVSSDVDAIYCVSASTAFPDATSPGRRLVITIDKYNPEIQSQSKSHRGTYTQTE